MKKIIALTVIMLCILLAVGPVGADSGVKVTYGKGDGKWVGNTWHVSLYPGEYKDTFMEVKNTSSGSLGIEMLVGSCCLVCVSPGSFTLDPGKTKKVYLTVKSPGDIAPGTYNVTWSIKTYKPTTPIVTPPITPPVDEEPEDEPPDEQPSLPPPVSPPDDEPPAEEPPKEEPPDEVGTQINWHLAALIAVGILAGLWIIYLVKGKKNKKVKEDK